MVLSAPLLSRRRMRHSTFKLPPLRGWTSDFTLERECCFFPFSLSFAWDAKPLCVTKFILRKVPVFPSMSIHGPTISSSVSFEIMMDCFEVVSRPPPLVFSFCLFPAVFQGYKACISKFRSRTAYSFEFCDCSTAQLFNLSAPHPRR